VRSKVFTRLYLTYVFLVLLTSASIGLLVHGRLERTLNDDLESTLERYAMVLEPVAVRTLHSEEAGLLDVIEAVRAEAGIRLTLIAADGRVLADSLENVSTMENHRERPEIKQSLKTGLGVARRFSQTVRYPSLYVARAVHDGEETIGILRVAIPLAEVDRQLVGMRNTVVLGGLVGILLALVVGAVVAKRVTSPVKEMTRVAEELRSGHYTSRVANPDSSELGFLGVTLNRLGEEITNRIETIGREDAQMRAILSGMGEGVVAVREDDTVVFCNAAARDFLDLQGADPTGSKFFELVRNADFSDVLDRARSTNAAAACETTVVVGEGTHVFRALANPFETRSARGAVLVLQDLTDLRRLEEMRRDFVANVSHELKTPLTSIKGYIETLLDGALHDSENNVRFLTKVKDNVERLSFLVTDLLSLARTESQEKQLELLPIDLQAVARQAVVRHERAMSRKSLGFSIEGAGQPVVVRGDRESIREVVDNLVSNANRYTPEGGQVRLVLSIEGAMGCLTVEDTGIGIPPQDLDHVFERFYRVDKARSRELGGTGLGLAIVKHLVVAMRGEVRVESTLGVGTRFKVRLPLAG